MRVLLDESLPRQLADELTFADVRSVARQGWQGLTNGELLRRAEIAGFEALLTADQNLQYQQNVAAYGLAVVVIKVRKNRMEELLPLVPAIRQALEIVRPGQVLRLKG